MISVKNVVFAFNRLGRWYFGGEVKSEKLKVKS